MTKTKITEPEQRQAAPPQEAPPAQLPAVASEVKQRVEVMQPPPPPAYPSGVGMAILQVMQTLGSIPKKGTNTFQHYKYARWQDVLDQLGPAMGEAGLIAWQSEVERSVIAHGILAIVYDIVMVHAPTEQQWPPIRWTGMSRLVDQKGMADDKAAPKCHTQAEKYALIKLFKIRVEDEEKALDTDGADGRVAKPPQAREDVMPRSQAGRRVPDAAASAGSSNASASAGKSSGNVAAAAAATPATDPNWIDPNSKPLQSMADVIKLETEARDAAARGTAVFSVLWRRLQTHQERAVVEGLKTELRELMTKADKQIETELRKLMTKADKQIETELRELLMTKADKQIADAQAAGADTQTGEIAGDIVP